MKNFCRLSSQGASCSWIIGCHAFVDAETMSQGYWKLSPVDEKHRMVSYQELWPCLAKLRVTNEHKEIQDGATPISSTQDSNTFKSAGNLASCKERAEEV